VLTIANRLVTALSDKQMGLSWTVSGSAAEGELISISRSEHPEGPWTALASVSAVTTTYNDTPNHYFYQRKYYYLIKSTEDQSAVDAVYLMNLPDNIAMEIVRQRERQLERTEGVECAIFTKTTTGARCPVCWNSKLDQPTKDKCSTCLGTRFETAFGNQIDAWVILPTDDVVNVISNNKNREKKNVRGAEMSNFPLVQPGDLIVDKTTMQIWEIPASMTIQRPSRRGYILSQHFQVERVPGDHPYKNLIAGIT